MEDHGKEKKADQPPLSVSSMGSFYIGGETVSLAGLPKVEFAPVPGSPGVTLDPNGDFQVGQMYVQYVRLAQPRTKFPVLMWHGGGLTGASWESRPDGTPGWQSDFLQAGFDVFLSDAVERGRSGWARYPEIYPGEPFFMPAHAAWQLYRIGPAEGYARCPDDRKPFENSRFPAASFDEFVKQMMPRWACNRALIQSAYYALLDMCGPAILIAHSQGADFALQAILTAPHKVKALVLVEPGGAPPPDKADYARLIDVPILVIWGDRVDAVPFWQQVSKDVLAMTEAVNDLGGQATTISLPDRGIDGNSHLIPMDDNASEIARIVHDWIVARL